MHNRPSGNWNKTTHRKAPSLKVYSNIIIIETILGLGQNIRCSQGICASSPYLWQRYEERNRERERKKQETQSSPFRPPAAAAGSRLHCCSPWSARQTSTPPLYRGSTPERSEERRKDNKYMSTRLLLHVTACLQWSKTTQNSTKH